MISLFQTRIDTNAFGLGSAPASGAGGSVSLSRNSQYESSWSRGRDHQHPRRARSPDFQRREL